MISVEVTPTMTSRRVLPLSEGQLISERGIEHFDWLRRYAVWRLSRAGDVRSTSKGIVSRRGLAAVRFRLSLLVYGVAY